MALFRVTQGAACRVPISGVQVPGLTGQGTRPVHVATGAAQSEPSATPRPVREYGYQCARWCWVPGAPGVTGGAMVDTEGARTPWWDECIYGGLC